MASDAQVGSLEIALARASEMMDGRPELAERQAREILRVVPSDPRALTLLGAALRRLGQPQAALAVLEPLAGQQPNAPQVHVELASARAAAGDIEGGVQAYRRALALKPARPDLWRALGDLLEGQGDQEGAGRARAEAIAHSTTDPVLIEAAFALRDDRIAVAERLLRERLRAEPTDAAALRMLGEAGVRLGRYGDAQAMFERCLELSPNFTGARHGLAVALFRQQKGAEALAEVRKLLAEDPHDGGYLALLAGALSLTGEYEAAIDTYADLLARQPGQPRLWLSQGHALRTAGRREEAIAAYRKSSRPGARSGESWWSLANLKTWRFEEGEVATMQAALGRARSLQRRPPSSALRAGQGVRGRGRVGGVASATTPRARGCAAPNSPMTPKRPPRAVDRSIALLQSDFFAARAGRAPPDRAPIFIVGLPRSGSTLLEQILASHSQVEGTMELPDIARHRPRPGRAAGGKRRGAIREVLADLAPAELRGPGRGLPRAHRESTASSAGRSSSTRCPTTSCTSA